MKLRLPAYCGIVFLSLALPQWAIALSPKPVGGPMVTTANANLRAKPNTSSEILISLKKGHELRGIGSVIDTKAPADEPREWMEVAAPAGTKVWVFAALVDPATKTVRSTKVNLRAGPGRNYAEVGYLLQGAVVQELLSNGGWIQIPAPEGTVIGYVAQNLVKPVEGPVASKAPAAEPLPKQSPSPNLLRASQRRPIPLPTDTSKPVVGPGRSLPEEGTATSRTSEVIPATAIQAPVTQRIPTSQPAVPEAVPPDRSLPEATLPIETPIQADPVPTASVPAQPEINHTNKPRQVIREGVVGIAMSPQAPGDYQLNNFRKGEGMIGFLATDNPEIKLSSWRWRRVLITGEEFLDARWPTSPLIKVTAIQPAF